MWFWIGKMFLENNMIRISPNNYARTVLNYIISLATTIIYLYFYAAICSQHSFRSDFTMPIFSDCVNVVLNSNFHGGLFGKTNNLCIWVQRGDGSLRFSPHILVCTCLPREPLLFLVIEGSREISGIKGHCLLADLMFPFVTITCWGQSPFVF